MDQAIKHKAVNGMLWTGVERIGTRFIQFIIEILIARVLLPEDYGLIGMLAIFMGIAQTFIDSGFANALIQKKDRNQDDFTTVFYFSLGVAFLLYGILFFFAPIISNFYNQPILKSITRIYMLVLIINGLSIPQTAKLTIELDFKTQAVISIVSICISGTIGIILAYSGYGVWALVWQGLTMSISRTITTWIASKWVPLLSFSKTSFKKLFSFGSKLLASSLINNIYGNISTLIIGKAYHATDLGFFTRANQFCQLPTQTITNIVIKVNYPILSQLQDDNTKLVVAYKTLLRTPIFILYPILFGLAILAKPLVILLLGDRWLFSASLIPILCFGCLWNPLTDINLNLLYVKGKTDLVLKLELIKKPIAFLMLIASIPLGLKGICVAISLYNFVAFCFNCYYTGKILDYGFAKQVKSLLPILGYCLIMASVVSGITNVFKEPLFQLVIGIFSGMLCYYIIALITHDQAILQLKQILTKHDSSIIE